MTCRQLVRGRPGIVAVAIMLLCAVSAPAEADGIFTPFAGVSFAEDDVERATTFGASLAAMAGGVFGFELDVARTSETPVNSIFADNRTTTVMGNLIVGVPLGPVRPYVVGGAGWMRTELLTNASSQQNDGLGVTVGGGVMGFFSEHVGVRFDLRYIRATSLDELDVVFGDFAFLRASAGLALRF